MLSMASNLYENYGEKRGHLRMQVTLDVEFKKTSSPKEILKGKSLNLSSDGILITTKTPLEQGEQLEIIVRPISDITPPLYAKAEVLRTDLNEDEGNYCIACRLDNVQ